MNFVVPFWKCSQSVNHFLSLHKHGLPGFNFRLCALITSNAALSYILMLIFSPVVCIYNFFCSRYSIILFLCHWLEYFIDSLRILLMPLEHILQTTSPLPPAPAFTPFLINSKITFWFSLSYPPFESCFIVPYSGQCFIFVLDKNNNLVVILCLS